MRRSERGKTKTTQKEDEEPQEKTVRKSQRRTRRRKKSTSSSDGESNSSTGKKDVAESLSQPLEIQVQDIELPQETESTSVAANNENETSSKPGNANNEWKEDSSFWEGSDKPKPTQEATAEDKEESSLWKVQSANGASGGEIQKLKICRQKLTESPEISETSLRKRLSRMPRDSRSTDESTQEETEKDTKKSKHRTRTSSRNSPLVSPTVVCDMSEGSPTKIKIINVSHLNTENKSAKQAGEVVDTESKSEQILELSQSDTLDIALPNEESQIIEAEVNESVAEKKNEEQKKEKTPDTKENSPKSEVGDDSKDKGKEVGLPVEEKKEDKSAEVSPRKTASPSPSPARRNLSRSTENSENSGDESQQEANKRQGLQSSVQRKPTTSNSPKQESSDSEDSKNKKKEKKEDRRESTDTNETKETISINNKENEAEGQENHLSSSGPTDSNADESYEKTDKAPLPRKRRWGSSKSSRASKKPVLINTDCLKNLIPDAKPVPADELQLSVEEEEGQLDDDDEEDEIVAMVAKEEEKERQREQREKDTERQEKERQKRQARFAKTASEQQPAPAPKPQTAPKQEKESSASRKILLLTDDVKKVARSPSPPRRKPTNVLYITHLVRPFTVQQLKNLLLRTGAIAENGFWIDKIKSKCYVEYMTEDQAVETRHALHGVRWPSSNPKTLVVEFASKEDLTIAQTLTEEPEVPRKSEPLTMVEGWLAEQARIKDRTKKAVVREWDVGKPEHPDEALEYEMKMKEKREQERKARKERHHRSASPENGPPARKPRKKEDDAPAKLLDDLFRKTKTSPCIYWLPLTQEQIAVKEEIRRQHMAEHERRMAEIKKADLARRERERRNRK
ncbi:apoptotic chromatin condensation inducer in the nucleus isoform X2 [Macrosteles quadrilineatus]|uniref:apoptotic chromatin condensation inducer in the nucleus isoform X2 n=1 Tax=Macrosteles quadrilineatus TaxID=74068 RepID=UPI0023E15836|nr:apoptotic chromatin condensation inducer in the nucleus isoform X2 [Macrosteles quadrilineatus]